MKFRKLRRFQRDWDKLPAEHQRMFRSLMRAFSDACDGYVARPGNFTWPATLRVLQMQGVKDIWEMTWSFSGPDGRATFEFTPIDGETGVLWRRIGTHEIYREP